jgi:hypothetical protein
MGRADAVEAAGDVTCAQVFVSGAVAKVSLPPTVVLHPDAAVRVGFDQDRLYLFYAATTGALTAECGG